MKSFEKLQKARLRLALRPDGASYEILMHRLRIPMGMVLVIILTGHLTTVLNLLIQMVMELETIQMRSRMMLLKY